MSDTDTDQFISSSTRFHRGTREDGAECGQVLNNGQWATVDAENPADAVLRFGVFPCSKCFNRVSALRHLYQKEHSASLVRDSTEDILARLPWEVSR